jgi:hypothetical protein
VGTITYTFTNSGSTTDSGTFLTLWHEIPAAPFYNDFGSTSGSSINTVTDFESWEIGDWENSSLAGNPGDFTANFLTSTNLLPESADDYLAGCTPDLDTGLGCNGDAGTALGDAFTVAPGYEETITLTVWQTGQTPPISDPFYLDVTNENEDGTGATGDVYFSLSAEEQQIPTGATPEPSTWLLMLSGLLILAWRMRRRFALKSWGRFMALLAVVAVALGVSARAQQVLTVPWDPTNTAAPHTAYAAKSIVLGAVFINPIAGHSYTYSWNYDDGSAATAATPITNFNDISSSHVYSGTTPGVTTWTAVVTVDDTTNPPPYPQYTGNYLVIWENNTLQSRVNVAIDWGLWYMHQSMYHPSPGVGNWDSCRPGYGNDCGLGYGSVTATNVQAFEVNGHLASGPATDPYTSDVAEGIADFWQYLSRQSVASKTYNFNPAVNNFGCSDGTAPTTTNLGSPHFYCDASATPVYYDAASTSCTSGSCSFTFDGNSNGYAVYATQQGYSWGYEDGMYADALVASGAPDTKATSGVLEGETYYDIVQDIADAAEYCQYGDDYDVSLGFPRGEYPAYNTYYSQGGGWWYNCTGYQSGDDNSVSQWAAIGLIAANRGFGILIPQIVPDANNMWVTASQNVQSITRPDADDPGDSTSTTYDYGGFGYNGSLYYSDVWSPWATTPSGMVQMSLDGIGRTANVAFGAGSNDPDQRFNNAETYYADNFCDPLTGPFATASYTPRLYTYGMFSFTKSMLLHNPNGTLSPIQFLRTQTPGVFTTNSSVPTNTIDWYAALSTANGGTDPCDGVAQTIVGRQNAAGYWYGDNYYGYQNYFETAWSLIMLQKSVFVACVNNLGGKGTASGIAPARIDLTWTGIPTAANGYEVLRGTANGGPYTEIGTTTNTSYSDRVGLSNGQTYYYVLEPLNSAAVTECQSNQATIAVPKPRL